MSETQTITTEINKSSTTIVGESPRANRTDVVIGGLLDQQEKPWNYEELGREAVAEEYHEANLDLASSLMSRIDAAVSDNGIFETPNMRATRVELPQTDETSSDISYRYEVSTVLGKQDRLSTTITVINGRPELTYYTEPVDTAAISPSTKPARYESGSWTPEDTAIDYVEQSLNDKLSTLDTILSKEVKDKAVTPTKRRLFGGKAINGSRL